TPEWAKNVAFLKGEGRECYKYDLLARARQQLGAPTGGSTPVSRDKWKFWFGAISIGYAAWYFSKKRYNGEYKMSYDKAEYQPGEEEALQALAESSDPLTRVIYHMSMRQLAATERMIRIEDELIAQGGYQRRLVEHLERRAPNWSSNLHDIIFGGG